MIKQNIIEKISKELTETYEELDKLLNPTVESPRYHVDESNGLMYRDLGDIKFTATKLKAIADRISKLDHYNEKKGY